MPTLFCDRGQPDRKETALSAPNDPWGTEAGQRSGQSGAVPSLLESQMVVPSTPDPEATADARWPSGRPLPLLTTCLTEMLYLRKIVILSKIG